MSELSDEQKRRVGQWIADGDGLADVQRKLAEEFGVSMTYMETRFLVDDLNLALRDKETDGDPADGTAIGDPGAQTEGGSVEEEAVPPAAGGSVSVGIDQVTSPNALISGKVTFSDGQRASWMLDQLGRLALDPDTPGYRPTEADVASFQQELQRVAMQQGL